MKMFALALLLAAPAAQAQTVPVQASLMAPGVRVADLDRSLKFYATALGLVPAVTLQHGSLTEVMLCADSKSGKLAVILLRDGAPGKAPPVALGNGFAKVLMRVPDLVAVVTRMKAAGYPVGEIHQSSQGPAVLTIVDPDGYTYELVGGVSHG